MKKLLIISIAIFLSTFIYAQPTWLKVAAGAEFAVALRSDSTLWSWGFNGIGQLGINSTVTVHVPTQIGTDKDWVNVSAGALHAFGIKANGTLWAWGYNSFGQLGDSTTTDRHAPVQVGLASDWKSVDGGQLHTVGLKTDNTIWAWGHNLAGELGLGSTAVVYFPAQIDTAHDWKDIRAGGGHSLGLKTDGSLWAWGLDASGQLGDTSPAMQSNVPVRVGTLNNWKAISAGFEYSIGLQDDSSMWTWGFNGNGQLGNGTTNQQLFPLQIGTGYKWIKMEAGSSAGYAIRSDSSLYSWGYNGYGQLGNGNTFQQISPTLAGSDKNWAAVSASKGFSYNSSVLGLSSYALKNSAVVICAAGANYVGQLGNNKTAQVTHFGCETGPLTGSHVGIATFETGTTDLLVFPNPANNSAIISLTKEVTDANIRIMNVTGQTVFEKTKQAGTEFTLEIAALPRGFYFIEVIENDFAWRSKLVKE